MEFRMNETTDAPQISETEKIEVSQKARESFDSLMGDDDLPEDPSYCEQSDICKEDEEISVECEQYAFDDLSHVTQDIENGEEDNPEIEKLLRDYFRDLKENSECPDTIPDKPFEVTDLRKRAPEENAEMREEFSDIKAQLKREWEEENGRPWPKYERDVYSQNGKLIRKAGSDYDAHHIHFLCMGGKNEAGNITPLHAEVHYDKQGVHSPDSPYSKLVQTLGGID